MGKVKINPQPQAARIRFADLPDRSFFLTGPCKTLTGGEHLYFKVDDKNYVGITEDHKGICPDVKHWTVWEVDASILYELIA